MPKGTNYYYTTDGDETPKPVGLAVDPTTGGLLTSGGGCISLPAYDSFAVTYVSSGNGAGEIETIVYSKSGSTVGTLTFTYNSDDKISRATLS